RTGAQHRAHPRTAAAREARRGPAPLLRVRGEAGVGVERPRVPDDLEEGDVLVPVRVAVAAAEVDAPARGELADRLRLGLAPAHRLEHLTGEDPAGHLQPGAEEVVDLEVARDRLRLEAGRRRREHHGVTAPAVGLAERAHLRVHHARETIREETLAELLELVLVVNRL